MHIVFYNKGKGVERVYKGIFWYIKNEEGENELVCIKAECDSQNKANVQFSSKSGENFNHKAEWAKLPHKITGGKPFDYYPRGRVEIKNGNIRIFCNPVLTEENILAMIIKAFSLENAKPKIIADASFHYSFEAF